MTTETFSGDCPDVLLEMRALTKHFDLTKGRLFKRKLGTVKALDGIDLSLRRGEVIGLIGESGCGKSTLVRCLMGLTEPTSGEIHWPGLNVTPPDLADQARRGQRVLAILQDPFASFPPELKASEVVSEPVLASGITDQAEVDRRIGDLLDRCGLPSDTGERRLSELSGGQRQRIGIARALALQPELLVCDDAVSALDADVRSQIVELLAELHQASDLAFLFLGHDLSAVQHLCDRVGVLYFGRLVEIGDRTQVLEQPKHPYSRALVAAATAPEHPDDEDDEAEATTGNGDDRLRPPPGCPYHPHCHLATPDCRTAPPPLRTLTANHAVACPMVEV